MSKAKKYLCPYCGEPITREMLIINDGYGNGYWVFCSHSCCRQYRRKNQMEGYGPVPASRVDELVEQVHRRQGWRISRYSTKILDKLAMEKKL